MINGENKIHILDIDRNENIHDTIDQVFKRYIHKATISESGQIISFKDDNVKISDWTGWTQLLSIKRIKTNPDWYKIEMIKSENEIIIDTNHLLPIYNSFITKIGFHGEVKYKYTLLPANELSSLYERYIRMRGLEDTDGRIIQFDQIKSVSNVDSILNENYGYIIETKSKFFNCNYYHLSTETEVKTSYK